MQGGDIWGQIHIVHVSSGLMISTVLTPFSVLLLGELGCSALRLMEFSVPTEELPASTGLLTLPVWTGASCQGAQWLTPATVCHPLAGHWHEGRAEALP